MARFTSGALFFLFLAGWASLAQTPPRPVRSAMTLRSAKGRDGRRAQHSVGELATTEVDANLSARLRVADGSKRGEAWFVFSIDLAGASPDLAGVAPEHVTIRIPISSTEDAYGESRSCTVAANGKREMVFTAGLDESNYVRFEAAEKAHDFHFLLNKYLCRVLAAPFHCGDSDVSLPKDVARWRLGAKRSVVLSSDAPAVMDAANIVMQSNGRVFDYAKCAVVAPSNGLCCVGGKTTEWHCGGTPVGGGWNQVSGECFHRETGGTCKD